MSFITLADLGQASGCPVPPASGVCPPVSDTSSWSDFANAVQRTNDLIAAGRLDQAQRALTPPNGEVFYFRRQLTNLAQDCCAADKIIKTTQADPRLQFTGDQLAAIQAANAAREAEINAVARDLAAQARNAADQAADPNAPGAGDGVVGGPLVSTMVTDSPTAMSLAAKIQGAKDVLSGKLDCTTLRDKAPDMAWICDVKKYAKYIGIAAAVGVGLYLFGPAIRGGSKAVGRRMNRRRR